MYVSSIERVDRSLRGGPTIAVLPWPGAAEAVEQLRQIGVPRLLVLSAEAPAIESTDDLEDWVRVPIGEQDVKARLHTLRGRAEAHRPIPILDGDRRLIYEGRWVALSETEERLAGPLVEHFPLPVRDEVLASAGWPNGAPSANGRRPTISRLRRRCAEVGLELTSVRGMGYALQPAPVAKVLLPLA